MLIDPVAATTAPDADPAATAATMTASGSLDAVTEDVRVNLLGGGWFVVTGLLMRRGGGFPRVVAYAALVMGALFVASSGKPTGIESSIGGGLIPLAVSVAGPRWPVAAGALALRRRPAADAPPVG